MCVCVWGCVSVGRGVAMKRRLGGWIAAPDGWEVRDQRLMLDQVVGAGGGLGELIAPWDDKRGEFTCYYGNNECRDETVSMCVRQCMCACVVQIHIKGRVARVYFPTNLLYVPINQNFWLTCT